MRVVGDQVQELRFRLRNEQTVEGVTVVERKLCHLFRMPSVDWQLLESILLRLSNQFIEVNP